MRDLLFALVWMALLPLVLISANAGALVWVWSALLAPNELLYGFMSSVPFNKIVAVLTIFTVFISKEKQDRYIDITLFLLILFALGGTVSWFNAMAPGPTTTELYEKLLKEIALVFVIATVMTTRAHIDRLVLVVVLAVGFQAAKEGTIYILSNGGHHIAGSGALGDNNGVAMALLMIIPLISYLARNSVVRIVRIGMWSLLGLSLVTVLATYSRDGFIGMVVLSALMIKNSRRRLLSICLAAFAAAFLYILASQSWFDRMDTIQSASDDSSFMGRVVAWKMSLLIAMDNPLFGGGMHAVQNQSVWDAYRKDFDLVDFVDTPPADKTVRAAHSIYFEVLGDLGFVGLALFLSILGVALWNCRQLNRMSAGHPSCDWAAQLARMLQICLIIYLITGVALSEAYLELFYILVALLSRCRRTVRLTLRAEIPQPESAAKLGTIARLTSPQGAVH